MIPDHLDPWWLVTAPLSLLLDRALPSHWRTLLSVAVIIGALTVQVQAIIHPSISLDLIEYCKTHAYEKEVCRKW